MSAKHTAEPEQPGGSIGLVGLLNRAFAPQTRWRGLGARVPAAARVRSLRARDGATVRAVHFPAPKGARTLVHFHGVGVALRDVVPFGEQVHRRGLGALLVEYRGYGRSPGSPTEAGLYEDALAALDALSEEGVSHEQIVLFGISLGAGVAVEMATRGRCGRLVLATPFTSLPDLVRHHLPFAPVGRLLAERFDNLRKAPHLAQPTLVIHGDADRVVPLAMARTLAHAIRGARLHTVAGGGHSNLFDRSDSAGLYDAITAHATTSGA